jgi:hypothetical protein
MNQRAKPIPNSYWLPGDRVVAGVEIHLLDSSQLRRDPAIVPISIDGMCWLAGMKMAVGPDMQTPIQQNSRSLRRSTEKPSSRRSAAMAFA